MSLGTLVQGCGGLLAELRQGLLLCIDVSAFGWLEDCNLQRLELRRICSTAALIPLAVLEIHA